MRLPDGKAAGYSMSSKAYEFTTESRSRFYRVSMVGMDGGRMTSVAVSPLQDIIKMACLQANNYSAGFLIPISVLSDLFSAILLRSFPD